MDLRHSVTCCYVQILKEVPEVEAQLASKGSNLVRIYTPSLVLYVVGVLRRYHCCLLCEYLSEKVENYGNKVI